MIGLVVAVDNNNVIGKDNKLIWHLPADLKMFKELTMGAPIVMGRKTFESIGKPLPGRTTVIITRNPEYKVEGCIVALSLKEGLSMVGKEPKVYVIGGGEIFKEAMPLADKLYLTRIHHSFEGDVYFPEVDMNQWEEESRQDFEPDEKNAFSYSFFCYRKKH
jgi:dihydrofolate reductase